MREPNGDGDKKNEHYDFGEKLEESHRAEDLPFWHEVYCEAFPDIVEMINHRADLNKQRWGIDQRKKALLPVVRERTQLADA